MPICERYSVTTAGSSGRTFDQSRHIRKLLRKVPPDKSAPLPVNLRQRKLFSISSDGSRYSMHSHVHARTPTPPTNTHTRPHAHTHTHTHTPTPAHTHTHAHTHTRTHAHAHAHARTRAHTIPSQPSDSDQVRAFRWVAHRGSLGPRHHCTVQSTKDPRRRRNCAHQDDTNVADHCLSQ